MQKNILIVEDDIYIIHAYTIKLAKDNINVNFVSDGVAALEFLQKNKLPDLIMLDLMIPKMNGFKVLEEIKKNADWKKIPVVILSNLGQQSDIEKGKALGATDYLVKAETNIDDVIDKIKKILTG